MTTTTAGVRPDHDLRGVLGVVSFRRLWTALSLSSLGDWLGLLALTAMAPRLADGGYAAANLAIAGVFILRLAPAVIFGPIAGVVADRLNRRLTMVVSDVVRFALFLSIPLVGTLWWLLVATFLIEVASLMWIPAKEATVPNLVPRERLEVANQLSLFATYGSAPVAAALFAGLALLTGVLDNAFPAIDPVDLALYVNAATFLVSAITILRLPGIPERQPAEAAGRTGVWGPLVEGWTYVGRNRLVRGLVVGMLGAFAAGGAVIGLARTFVADLGAGDPGYGLLFGTVFLGLAGGMFLGPRLLPDLSRRRLFGLSIGAAGLALAALALLPHMVIATFVTLVLGACAGVAWVTGYTLLGLEVVDDLRGRTFAFVQTMVRLVLVAVLALAPLLAAAFGAHRVRLTDEMSLTYNGAAITFLLAGLLAAVLGWVSYRALDDRRGIPLRTDLASALAGQTVGPPPGRSTAPGFLVAFEGGEGAGKSTQARLLASWLEQKGHDVVVTREPGGTEMGRRLRSVLLDRPADLGAADAPALSPVATSAPAVSPRAEALLFAADRAEHVARVIRPALELGHVVVTDRYVDSSIAYQGAGRDLGTADVARLSHWATDGLAPDLTVLLDLPAVEGLRRVTSPDRLESEPVEFHERVRTRFQNLARRGASRYLVVDAAGAPEQIAAQVQQALAPLLPPSAAELRAAQEAARQEEQRRAAEEARRRLEEARARADAQEQARRAAAEAEERRRQEEAVLAEQRRLEAEAVEERRRRAELEAQERAQAEAARAAEHAARKEEKRRLKEEQRLAAEEAQRRVAERRAAAAAEAAAAEAAAARRASADAPTVSFDGPTAPVPYTAPSRRPAQEPPAERTRPPSLADELFGFAGDDDGEDDVQLPRVSERDDR